MQAANVMGTTQTKPLGGFAFHARWAFAGFGIGLLVFLPWVIWMTQPVPVVVTEYAAPSSKLTLVDGPKEVTRKTATDAAAEERVRILDSARGLLANRAITSVRAVLKPLVDAGDAEALFLTAQTYDPIQLAVLDIGDGLADTNRARHFYSRALAAGHEAAQGRLDQLR